MFVSFEVHKICQMKFPGIFIICLRTNVTFLAAVHHLSPPLNEMSKYISHLRHIVILGCTKFYLKESYTS